MEKLKAYLWLPFLSSTHFWFLLWGGSDHNPVLVSLPVKNRRCWFLNIGHKIRPCFADNFGQKQDLFIESCQKASETHLNHTKTILLTTVKQQSKSITVFCQTVWLTLLCWYSEINILCHTKFYMGGTWMMALTNYNIGLHPFPFITYKDSVFNQGLCL